jgi:hypothetical protein
MAFLLIRGGALNEHIRLRHESLPYSAPGRKAATYDPGDRTTNAISALVL